MLGQATLLPLLLLAQALLARASSLDACSATVPAALKQRAHSDRDGACPLPVDDRPETWPPLGGPTPWTHPPECEYAAGRAAKYCAYTNSRHGPRGWSIVTTPETAADSVGILDTPLDDNNKNSLNVSSSSSRHAGTAPYKIVDIPGKGKGLVATRRIARHDEILADYATVLVDIAFATRVPALLGYRLLHAAVDRLADPGSILELGRSSDFALDEVENVLRTNSFHTLLGGVPHMAVYPAVSVRGASHFFVCLVVFFTLNSADLGNRESTMRACQSERL